MTGPGAADRGSGLVCDDVQHPGDAEAVVEHAVEGGAPGCGSERGADRPLLGEDVEAAGDLYGVVAADRDEDRVLAPVEGSAGRYVEGHQVQPVGCLEAAPYQFLGDGAVVLDVGVAVGEGDDLPAEDGGVELEGCRAWPRKFRWVVVVTVMVCPFVVTGGSSVRLPTSIPGVQDSSCPTYGGGST